MKNPLNKIKNSKHVKAISIAKGVAKDLKTLPGDSLVANYVNQVKLRQIQWTERGFPITPEELEAGLKKEWKRSGWIYRRAGVTYEKLLAAGLEALADPGDAEPVDSVIQKVTDKIGRNVKCPCGSGKKFKKCCGKDQ